MGRYLWLAAEKLVKEYHTSAKEIWEDATAQTIVERLEQFVGISHKKASLACLLLWRDLNVDIPDKQNIDIIYDVHIRRIFLRAGFCEKDTQKEVIAARKKRNALKALYDAMVAETEFLERGYYSCKSTAEWPLKAQQRGFNNNQGVS